MKLTTKKLYELIQETMDKKTNNAATAMIKMFTKNAFTDAEDFINKAKIYKKMNESSGELLYSLYLPDKDGIPVIACTVGFDVLDESDNCRPELGDTVGTAILSMTGRSEEFRGMGLGKILSLMALADLSRWKYSVTTDRDTSDNAGRALVDSLKMLPIKKSKPFDYIGWLKKSIGEAIEWINDPTNSVNATHYAEGLSKVQELYDHLQPLTPNEDDDCQPSANLMVRKNDRLSIFVMYPYKKKYAPVVEKLLSMSNEQIRSALDSDKNVTGYTFDMNSQSFNAPLQYLLDKTVYGTDSSPEDHQIEYDKSSDLFSKVYDKTAKIPKVAMFGDDMIKESISKDHREKLIKLLLNSVRDANMAFDLMDRLEIDSLEQLKIINDAILRDPKMAQNPAGVGKISELYQTLKQKINFILIRDLEAFDLGDS